IARLWVEGESRRVAHPRRVGRLVAAVSIKALNRGLRLGLDAEIAGRPDPHEECPGLGINREVPILVSGRYAEDALLGEERGPVGAGRGVALFRRHLLSSLRGRGASRTHGPKHMRHAPDGILVDHQHMIVAPRQAIWAIEILDVASDPFCLAVALV